MSTSGGQGQSECGGKKEVEKFIYHVHLPALEQSR